MIETNAKEILQTIKSIRETMEKEYETMNEEQRKDFVKHLFEKGYAWIFMAEYMVDTHEEL